MYRERLLSALEHDSISATIKNIREDLNKLKRKFLRSKINKIRRDLYEIEYQYNDGIIMEYQNIEHLLNNASNQPSKFRTKNWVETIDESRGKYAANKQIKFKTSMLRSSLCDYSDAYMLFKGKISVNNTAAAGADANNTIKKVKYLKIVRHLLNA